MEISLNQLLEGKPTIIKGKEYNATKDFVLPFIEKIKPITVGVKIFVKVPDQVTVTKIPDLTYNKVLIQAKLKTDINIRGFYPCICMAYALDVRKPVCKIYKGYINDDNHFITFNQADIFIQAIEPEQALNYNVKGLMELPDTFKVEFQKIADKKLINNSKNINELTGKWIDEILQSEYSSEFGKIKLSPNLAIDAYKLLFKDISSKHYIKEGVEEFTALDVYLTFIKLLVDDTKEIINKFEKSLLIKNLFNE